MCVSYVTLMMYLRGFMMYLRYEYYIGGLLVVLGMDNKQIL